MNDPAEAHGKRSAEEISTYVLAHLPPCRVDDLRCGNIVLLHDGGGDRSETVRALPMIIDGIRSRGYEVAPVYELIGMQKAQVMAPLPRDCVYFGEVSLSGAIRPVPQAPARLKEAQKLGFSNAIVPLSRDPAGEARTVAAQAELDQRVRELIERRLEQLG